MKHSGIKVRYIYSACVVTETKDLKICHDPWFTEGVYDGAWYHFPKVENPLERIGDVDCFYVSHIHPDHYDSSFLKAYFDRFGQKKILIAQPSGSTPNYLLMKMKADRLEPTVLAEPWKVGNTRVEIIPHSTGSVTDIDSAILIQYEDEGRSHRVLNVNDIIFDDEMIAKIREKARGTDILLCGYTGAGPYPQTYFDPNDPQLLVEAENKKKSFFDRYRRLVAAIEPRMVIPFAGKYILGGRLATLNPFRGVADATEVLNFDPTAVVLSDQGGEVSTMDFEPRNVRTARYSEADVQRRVSEISACKMDYERLIPESEIPRLPLKKLLRTAASKAVNKSECKEDYFFVFKLPDGECLVVNARKGNAEPVTSQDPNGRFPEPYSEILIDPRYLFGLLVGVYHWNNAEVGSQFQTRRVPNFYNRQAQRFLSFLSV